MGTKLTEQTSITTESLVPRLGDSLLEAGEIIPEQLQQALDYQKGQSAIGKPRLLGQALIDLGFIDRDTLDNAIARRLTLLHDALVDSNQQLELRVNQRTEELQHRIVEIRTAAEITQMAVNTTNLNDLLNHSVNLIANRFGYSQVIIFLVDPLGQYAILSEASGSIGASLKKTGYKLPVGSQSMVGWVAEHNQVRVSNNVGDDPFYREEGFLSDTKSEVTLPLSINDLQGNPQVLGVMDVQHTQLNAFDRETIATLQTVANHIAATIYNQRLLENTQKSLYEVSNLYQSSRLIARAGKIGDIIDIATNALKQAPFLSAVLLPDQKHMVLYQLPGQDIIESSRKAEFNIDRVSSDATDGNEYHEGETTDLLWPLIPMSELMNHFKTNELRIIDLETETILPRTLLAIPRHFACTMAAYLPVIANGKIEAIFILGSKMRNLLTKEMLQPYASLCEQTSTALEKVLALQNVEKRLAALQTLNSISQAVSVETDLPSLYRSVHQEVTQVMGNLSFIIAIYDKQTNQVSIPYMYEENTVRSVDPYPLGKGLISIVINTRQPLMIVEDTENKSRELGAIILGAPAKSWMGVPLLVGNEVIGAIVVQDTENEYRFDEDDLRLMSTLALQVAAGLRNAHLLESTYRQAERERALHEISKKIRSSTDMQAILKTTVQEIGKYTGARRTLITLGSGEQDKSLEDKHVDAESGTEKHAEYQISVPPSSSVEDSV